MEYRQRENGTASVITTGLRQRFEVENGTFEVPDDLDSAAHRRLIDAGHEPVEPEELPAGVEYEPTEDSESGSSSDSGEETVDAPAPEEESEESASGNESGSMTADRILGTTEETPDPPQPLDEMNRSELYQFGNDQLGLGLEWSGDEALGEEEMRERVSKVVNDGE